MIGQLERLRYSCEIGILVGSNRLLDREERIGEVAEERDRRVRTVPKVVGIRANADRFAPLAHDGDLVAIPTWIA